jgi:hypothetical protein
MYLPSTTINSQTKITLQRMLPVPGQILVQPGQVVEALTVVAQAEVPSRYRVIDVARQLNQPHPDMGEIVLVAVGDQVKENQVVASIKGRLPGFQRSVRAPAAGFVATVGPGWLLLETERTTLELQAFIHGKVSRILANQRGVIIEASGAMIEAACGFGGEALGRLKRLVNSPYEALRAEAIDENVRESIVLGGRTVDEETLRQAEAWHVRGIIVGSIESTLLQLDPPVRVRVVATEGFGNLPMSNYTFSLLTSLSRREISIRGCPPNLRRHAYGQATADTPLILATDTSKTKGNNYSTSHASFEKQKPPEVALGSRVRITGGTLLGSSGKVESIPPKPQATEAGIMAAGAYIKLNNRSYFVPWANLELVV